MRQLTTREQLLEPGTPVRAPVMARPGSGLLMPVNGLGYPPQNMARVVVWEWLNEHGRWRPYSAAVCHHIENVLKGDARGSVVLGQVDGQLAPYVIDLQSMHQFRQDTGRKSGCRKLSRDLQNRCTNSQVTSLRSARKHCDLGRRSRCWLGL